MSAIRVLAGLLVASLLALGCSPSPPSDQAPNPFLADQNNRTKGDTAYMNPEGMEVEVDVEADAQAPGMEYNLPYAPPQVTQFALTYLRKRGSFYLESLAEDATSKTRVEWLIDGTWVTAERAASLGTSKLKHFRIRGMNAVLLYEAARGVKQGDIFTAEVPLNPYTVMQVAGDKCADPDSHIALDQSVYWYMWNPEHLGCKGTVATQEMQVTVSKMIPSGHVTYPEYDQLVADGKVTAVILFGQIGDGAITDTDPGVVGLGVVATWLAEAGFVEVTSPPLGRRFTKHVGQVDFEIDLYSPREFSGLGDYMHFNNFQKALSEHEIVVYDGHSMLGASDFWSRPKYPSFYQIFLYGGCLGYEYYLRPILSGKGGWQNLDLMSSVVEVSANASAFAGPFLAKMAWALDHGNSASWKDMIVAVRKAVGNSQFGVSGVRDNCYSPLGTLCEPTPPPDGTTKEYENTTAAAIPDNDHHGITSVIEIPDDFLARTVTVDLDITHTYVGDLRIWIEHDGFEAELWKTQGGDQQDLKVNIAVEEFVGKPVKGVWTLHLADLGEGDTGSIQRWALELTP
jgi:hypothetical protein